MNNVVNIKTVEQLSALDEYRRFFPGNEPSCFQQDLIEGTVTDLGAWRKALEFWAGNDYRAQSIQKILDYYESVKNGSNKNNTYGRKQSDPDRLAESAEFYDNYPA